MTSLTAAHAQILAASGRTATAEKPVTTYVRVSSREDRGGPGYYAPRKGDVIALKTGDLALVLASSLEWWSQERVDEETLAPDGEPDAGWIATLTAIRVASHPQEHAEAEREARRDRLRRAYLDQIRYATQDRELPPADDPVLQTVTKLPQVPTGLDSHWVTTFVDEDGGAVWLQTYNGLDGDNWDASNYGSHQLWRLPLTPARQELVAGLRREFEIDQWCSEGVDADAARVLADAGWSATSPPLPLDPFRLRSAEDARDLLVMTPQEWAAAGWVPDPNRWPRSKYRFGIRPAVARRLATAGMGFDQADALAAAGFKTAEEILAASAPTVPDTDGHIRITTKEYTSPCVMITNSAADARAWLAARPEHWHATVTAHPGDIVHTGDVLSNSGFPTASWALTSDGELFAAQWITWTHPGVNAEAARPELLPAGAVAALSLLAGADNSKQIPPAAWHPLRAAVSHRKETLSTDHKETGARWSVNNTLTEHTFTMPSGPAVHWWQHNRGEGGMSSDGEGDYWENYTLHTSLTSARAMFDAAR